MTIQHLPCEAFTDWPGGRTLCGKLAVFLVDRLDDARLSTCAEHLGPILQYGANVIWPPAVEWLGDGLKPPASVDGPQ